VVRLLLVIEYNGRPISEAEIMPLPDNKSERLPPGDYWAITGVVRTPLKRITAR
jgi:hypothetical protein